MAYVVCNSAGSLLLGTTSASTTNLFGGAGIEDCSLSVQVETIEAMAIEDRYPQVDVVGRSFIVTATILHSTADPGEGFHGTSFQGDVWATVKDAAGSTLVAGSAIIASAQMTMSSRDYQRWQVEVRFKGTPSTLGTGVA